MKVVVYEDSNGYKRRAILRDNDPDHVAHSGIPLNPPDLEQIDWEEVKRELHNLLSDRGLFTWADVQAKQNGVSSSILDVLRRRVITLYRLKDTNGG